MRVAVAVRLLHLAERAAMASSEAAALDNRVADLLDSIEDWMYQVDCELAELVKVTKMLARNAEKVRVRGQRKGSSQGGTRDNWSCNGWDCKWLENGKGTQKGSGIITERERGKSEKCKGKSRGKDEGHSASKGKGKEHSTGKSSANGGVYRHRQAYGCA